MKYVKRIIVMKADGTITELAKAPTLAEMQKIVGGYVEHVAVMDRVDDDTGEIITTSMFVNEEGLLTGLPRNDGATRVYQRLTRHQFPDAANPFRAAKDEMRKRNDRMGWTTIEGTEPIDGYNDDPWIAGDAILFGGYTIKQAEKAIEIAERKAA